jgi:branched-chain amino acid transport system substrate-binding protein
MVKRKRWLGFVLCIVLLGSWGVARGADEIRIGVIAPMTGVFASFGKFSKEGAILAFEEVKYKAAGKPVKAFYEDTQGQVEVMVTKMRALVERDKVHAIIGPVLGHEGIAAADWGKGTGVPILVAVSAPEDVTMRKRSFSVIRPGWSGGQTMFAFGEYAAKELKWKRIVMVGQDYAYPHNQCGAFIKGFCNSGGKEVIKIWHPVGQTDYSSILATLPKDIDGAILMSGGSDVVSFIKQWHDFGLAKKYKLLGGGSVYDGTILQELGKNAIGGLSTLHYAEGLSTPQFLKFKNAYVKKFKDQPAFPSDGYYASVIWALKGAEAVKGKVEDREAYIKAMRTLKWDDAPRGPISLDEFGNPIQNVYLREVVEVKGEITNKVIKVFPKVSQFGPFADDPEGYMAMPGDARDYPPGDCEACMKEMKKYMTKHKW